MGRFEVRIPKQANISSPRPSGPALGPTKPPIQWIPAFFPGVKRPKRFVDHCSLSSAEVKNEWRYTSIPVSCLHDVDSHGFTFVLTAVDMKMAAF